MFGHNKQPSGPEKLKPKKSEKKERPSYLNEEEKPTFFEDELGPLEKERREKEEDIKRKLEDFSKM